MKKENDCMRKHRENWERTERMKKAEPIYQLVLRLEKKLIEIEKKLENHGTSRTTDIL